MNGQNVRGDSVLLSLATTKNFRKVDISKLYGIKLLLKSGANINRKNNLGQNALESYIMEYERPDEEVLLLLSAAGEIIDNLQSAKADEGEGLIRPLVEYLPTACKKNWMINASETNVQK